jgi:hypothetical protein
MKSIGENSKNPGILRPVVNSDEVILAPVWWVPYVFVVRPDNDVKDVCSRKFVVNFFTFRRRVRRASQQNVTHMQHESKSAPTPRLAKINIGLVGDPPEFGGVSAVVLIDAPVSIEEAD